MCSNAENRELRFCPFCCHWRRAKAVFVMTTQGATRVTKSWHHENSRFPIKTLIYSQGVTERCSLNVFIWPFLSIWLRVQLTSSDAKVICRLMTRLRVWHGYAFCTNVLALCEGILLALPLTMDLWCGTLMFSFMACWRSWWANRWVTGDLRRHNAGHVPSL